MVVAELILKYVQALIWPAVALTALLLFRRELRRLMAAVRRFRFPGGAEVDIGALVDDAEATAKKALQTSDPSQDTEALRTQIAKIASIAAGQRLSLQVAALDLDYYRSIALSDPNLALAGLRMGLERALTNIAEQCGMSQKPNTVTTARVAKALSQRGFLPDQLRTLAREIANIANAAIHGQPATTDEALRVIDSAEPIRNFYFTWLAQHVGIE